MRNEEIEDVYQIARIVAREEIAKALAALKPVEKVETPKPVEVEIQPEAENPWK
jgi:hypothetical protein